MPVPPEEHTVMVAEPLLLPVNIKLLPLMVACITPEGVLAET